MRAIVIPTSYSYVFRGQLPGAGSGGTLRVEFGVPPGANSRGIPGGGPAILRFLLRYSAAICMAIGDLDILLQLLKEFRNI